MSKLTHDDVRNLARELGVKFVRLQFTDIFGVLKNVSITVEQLDKALDGELMFDGSSIEGFVLAAGSLNIRGFPLEAAGRGCSQAYLRHL